MAVACALVQQHPLFRSSSAPPFFYLLLSKLRELSLAHRELLTIASTDPLTNCLNRRAFTALVDGYLSKFDDSAERGQGALFVLGCRSLQGRQ